MRDFICIVVIVLHLAAVTIILTGCTYTAHVAARPVIQGTPVSVGVEVGR